MNQTRQSREELKAKVRPGRISVYEANRNKITVTGLDQENFMYRWVNDTEGRLDMFLAAQWEFVPKKGHTVGDGGIDLSNHTSSALSRGMGNGIVAFLMRIPMEIWLADQDRKEKEQVASLEADMRKTAKNSSDYGKVQITSTKS